MRRHSEHSSQMVISEGLPHILQTWCACSGRGSGRGGTMFMLCLLSNLVRRLIDADHRQFYSGAKLVCECKTPQTETRRTKVRYHGHSQSNRNGPANPSQSE